MDASGDWGRTDRATGDGRPSDLRVGTRSAAGGSPTCPAAGGSPTRRRVAASTPAARAVAPVGLAAGPLDAVRSVGEALLGTFGPFVIPVVLFVVGVCFYALLWYLGKTELPGE